ncbi:hypothetical protein [Solitalea koreensis]|uniref:Uncharacterized protein n=1 Tax=Solitalea koreensis TaxID=543615 RepID=A0A521C5M8_9SPHI|nr:hypothetical protein [Solitalea koreensis]SMO54718.1 hypothetical protein SAMN06265350_103232 [Solitalea koreensis]
MKTTVLLSLVLVTLLSTTSMNSSAKGHRSMEKHHRSHKKCGHGGEHQKHNGQTRG